MNYWTQSKRNIYVAAHRGDSARYPENTMPAFRAALEAGADQLETDVRVTRDGELVLIHDATVDRTTNGTGKVCDMTLSELRALDAGSHKGEQFRGEKIPTLREFFELVKDHPTITLDLELKEYPTIGWEETAYDVCDRTFAMVEEYGFADRIVVNTFHGKLHEYIMKKYGNRYRRHVYYPFIYMGKHLKNVYEGAYCCCMFSSMPAEWNMAEKWEFDRMESWGIQPWAGACVKDDATVTAAIERGATLITCNNPDVVLDLLRQKGYHQ